MMKEKDDELVTKGLLKKELKNAFTSFEEKMDQKMEMRFEKQELMLEQRLQQQTVEIQSVIKYEVAALVEIVRDEVGGAYHDELVLVKDKVGNHEHRI